MSFKRLTLVIVFVAAAACGAGAQVRDNAADADATRAASETKGAPATSTPRGTSPPATSSAPAPSSSSPSSLSPPPSTSRDLSRYEGRPVSSVEVVIEEAASDPVMVAEFRALLTVTAGGAFSAVQLRESLQALFDSERVANARVEASDAPGATAGGPVTLRFVVRPRVLVERVNVELGPVPEGAPVSADDLRARIQFLEPGRPASEQSVRANADLIQSYLRDRGFYRANVEFEQQLDQTRTRAAITYAVALGPQSTVGDFRVQITGFDPSAVLTELRLQRGAPFTQEALGQDLTAVRQAVLAVGHLAPRINEPRVRLNSETNTVDVEVTGAVGPKVNVVVKDYELSETQQRELLPVMREGTIDASAIVEGQRRLRNRLQEDGFFFNDVSARCAVAPPRSNGAAPPADEGEGAAGELDPSCANLDPEELSGRSVTITYEVVGQPRRFKLTSLRLINADGTTPKLSIEDVRDDLRSREANELLGLLPFFKLGRGYTSNEALSQDQRTILARMRDLGYRQATVEVRQGVSLEGEGLIITFAVNEGPLTRVADVEIRGNKLFTAEQLRAASCPDTLGADEACTVLEGPFSRSQARIDADRLRNYYARRGYLDADVDIAVVDLPERGGDQRVRLVYTVTEAEKVFINRVVVHGLVNTKPEAILEAIPLRAGGVLRADQISESERVLYNTDAFRQVIIRTEPAVETAGGFKARDVIIDVEERRRYVMDYGGGYSTDNGPLGLFEIRNNNLFGQLRQGAFRSRVSPRQQLVRLEYFDPRFMRYAARRRYGAREFAPLTVSAQYQLDSTVTRFFRSTLDRSQFGIVQRLDPEGRPIDINCPLLDFDPAAPDLPAECMPVGTPTINRFTINVETQRDFELQLGRRGEVQKRSTLFLRYNYEDVRLFNIQSLLIADLLRPDRAVRLSRFGVTFARDTRDRALDATRGDFLTADYAIALKQLGGNLSFSKLLLNYRRYYSVPRARNTVLAAGVQLGLSRLYGPSDRGGLAGVIDEADLRLPISERFFSGGSTTLRGFGSEEAGPRVVVPGGVFRNDNGDEVTVQPFTVPIGGNALAVVNLEARVPVTKNIQVVPFYDGGNVFRSVGDLFGREPRPGEDPNLRSRWTHTVGLGVRFKTPVGPLAVDYGFLLNPPEFLINPANPAAGVIRLRGAQLHFRFGQTF